MALIEMYVTDYCGWCIRAKNLLAKFGVTDIKEIDVSNDRFEVFQRTGGRMSVPQIFINDRLIGGFDDLSALVRAGKLQELLEEEWLGDDQYTDDNNV